MGGTSSIEWTDATWNPIAGCTPISPGCKNCYAARLAWRLARIPGPSAAKYQDTAKRFSDGRLAFTGTINIDEVAVEDLKSWRKPRRIFVNSMSDLFHEAVPTLFIVKLFSVMAEAPHHSFQVLTKRPARVVQLADRLSWGNNIWIGTSVESKPYIYRVRELQSVTQARIRFISCEPLLGPLRALPLQGIDWVIVGGESGPRARPMEESWVSDIRLQCARSGTAFFFKQWGGVNKKLTGRLLAGRTWDEMPIVMSS